MSDLNPKAANNAAISRQRFGWCLIPALLLMLPVTVGFSQNRGPVLDSQAVVNPPGQQTPYGSESGNSGFDSLLAERRMKMLNNERRKSLISDSDKLLKLAIELNVEIGQSKSGSLTPDQLRKVADIEKLAHNVRDKMVMTLPTPSANFFPINGPAFNQ
jgi:hypothetical protein